jgi:hypothetical protein
MMEKRVIGDIKETKGTIQMAREIKGNNVEIIGNNRVVL